MKPPNFIMAGFSYVFASEAKQSPPEWKPLVEHGHLHEREIASGSERPRNDMQKRGKKRDITSCSFLFGLHVVQWQMTTLQSPAKSAPCADDGGLSKLRTGN